MSSNKEEEGEGWCRYMDCDEPYENGVTFLPVAGNAIFWTNLLEGGEGDGRVLHAGLPVQSRDGEKVGLNIWTREGGLAAKYRGEG